MFEKIFRLISEAIRKFKPIEGKEVSNTIYPVADKMRSALDRWKNMYADEAPWLDYESGVYSFGIPSSICEELSRYVLTELDAHIVVPGVPEGDKAHDASSGKVITNRAEWLDDIFHKKLLNNIPDILEKAMAYGGVVIKPYLSGNSIHYDLCYQGEFVPIAFDDDGNIIDIAFLDSFINGSIRYAKVERHTFNASGRTITISNRAYRSKVYSASVDIDDLGIEIPLSAVNKWAMIEPDIDIENIDRPMYGYYKTPIANNIDIKCPLGVSVFHKATGVIERADRQYSRLDWEYDGGQIAIDVDPTAVRGESGYYNRFKMDEGRNRLYRKLDLGSDDTYKAFAPTLRDASYIDGLNKYLMRIEDICGLARGSISFVDSIARTATEIVSTKQKTLVTTRAHQEALQKCFEDVIYATNVLAEYYKDELDAKDGEYVFNVEWSDSAVVDTYTELEQKLNMAREGILSKAEVRSWYTGEDIETATANIEKIASDSNKAMMNDIFSSIPQTTIEA